MNARATIPDRMRHLDMDARGYAIPFGVLRDADGTPQFAVNNEHERERSIRNDLCSICGTKLLRGRWFVGGPRSAFDSDGAYIDMPMHDECAHYALKVCPYLAAPHYGREVGGTKAAQMLRKPLILIDRTMIADRPPLFVAVMAVGQRMTQGNSFGSYVIPARPHRKVEYWQTGRQLPDAEGAPIAAEACGFAVANLASLARGNFQREARR
jgi:hypothetical protein